MQQPASTTFREFSPTKRSLSCVSRIAGGRDATQVPT
jgi:hypothetical protein